MAGMKLDSSDVRSLTEILCSEIEEQLSARAQQEDNWEKWLNIYRGKPDQEFKNSPWPGASNLVVALGGIYVDTIVARVMQGIFATEPHWTARQLNKRKSLGANPVERFLDWHREFSWNQYDVVKKMVLETCKLGTGIIYNGWRDDAMFTYQVSQTDPKESGFALSGRCTGPQPRWVPREDFLNPSAYPEIPTSPWIGMRQWWSRMDLRKLDAEGDIENFEDLNPTGDEESNLRRLRREDLFAQYEPRSDEFSLYGIWQVWFSWDFDKTGIAHEYVAMIHPRSKVILRLDPNPYPYGLRPFIHATYIQQEGVFDGVGIPELIEHYQREVSTIHNQRRDNAHLANIRQIIASKNSGLTEKSRWFPGKITLVTDISQVKEFKLGEVYPSSFQEEQITTGYAERRIGISDQNLGQMTSPMGRAAASTMLAVMQEGTRRHDLNTSEIRRALSEQGLQILDLWQTHGLPEPDYFGSPESILDPEDAAQVRSVLEAPDSIRGAIQLKLNVSTAAVNQEIEKQSSIQLLGIVTQYVQQVAASAQMYLPMLMNPQTPQPIKDLLIKLSSAVDTAMEQVFQSHQRFDYDSILVGDILQQLAGPVGAMAGMQMQMQQQQAAAQQQMMGAANGSGAAGGPGAGMGGNAGAPNGSGGGGTSEAA